MPNAEQYTQSELDNITDSRDKVQHLLDWHNDVNRTYDLTLFPLSEESGGTVSFPYTGTFTGTGRSGYYTQWRVDNPNAIAYVDGTDSNESGNYNVWNEVVNGVVHATHGSCKPTSTHLTEMQTNLDALNAKRTLMAANLTS